MIYFAQFPNGTVKIGSSVDPRCRMKKFRSEYRVELSILAVKPGGPREEYRIHRRFAHLRFPGTEQFRPAPELLEFIGRPLFASQSPELAGQIERRCPQKYDLGLTRRDLRSIDAVCHGSILTQSKQLRWVIRVGYQAVFGKIPE